MKNVARCPSLTLPGAARRTVTSWPPKPVMASGACSTSSTATTAVASLAGMVGTSDAPTRRTVPTKTNSAA